MTLGRGIRPQYSAVSDRSKNRFQEVVCQIDTKRKVRFPPLKDEKHAGFLFFQWRLLSPNVIVQAQNVRNHQNPAFGLLFFLNENKLFIIGVHHNAHNNIRLQIPSKVLSNRAMGAVPKQRKGVRTC